MEGANFVSEQQLFHWKPEIMFTEPALSPLPSYHKAAHTEMQKKVVNLQSGSQGVRNEGLAGSTSLVSSYGFNMDLT